MLVLFYTSKDACVNMFASRDAWVALHKQGCLGCFTQAGMLVLLCLQAGMLVLLFTSKDACITMFASRDAWVVLHKQGCLCYYVCKQGCLCNFVVA